MKRIIILAIAFINCSIYAQQWQWDSVVSKSSTSNLLITKNHADEVFTFQFQGSELKKYNSAGKFLWAKSFNGSLFNVSFDLANNIYITGTFFSALTEDSVTLTSKGDDDIFVLKLAPNANMVWLHQIGSIGRDVAGDVNIYGNKIFVSGATRDTTWFDQIPFPKKTCFDMFIARFDMNVNLEKVKFAEQPVPDQYYASIGCELENDASGNVIVLAAITGQIKIDTTVISDGYAYYVLKFDTALDLLWNRRITSGMGTGAGCLRVNSTGEIVLTTSVDWHYFQEGDVRKISLNGDTMQTLFTENIGFVYGIDLDSADNIYFTGMRMTWAYSGNPPNEYYFKTGKLNPTGNLVWLIQDSSLYYREGYSIAALSNNSLFISGRFFGKMFLHDTLIAMSDVNCFLSILDVNTYTPITELNNEENSLVIFPNPSPGIFTINLNKNNSEARICVRDILGNYIHTKNYSNDLNPKIDLSHQPKGIYFAEIICDGKSTVKKIILE